jgi:hypothetical protein
MKKAPPWRRHNPALEQRERQDWLKREFGANSDEHYWELSHEYLDASIRSSKRYLKAMRLLPRRRGRQAGEPHAGDLTEMDKLQLIRAYQCEDAIFAKLKSFRLSADDREAVRVFAAAHANVSVEQMEKTRPNRRRTLR